MKLAISLRVPAPSRVTLVVLVATRVLFVDVVKLVPVKELDDVWATDAALVCS
jgi:hypothetical protein